jgi:signal transduction histidine kinase/CheY-like chemotaxis protein
VASSDDPRTLVVLLAATSQAVVVWLAAVTLAVLVGLDPAVVLAVALAAATAGLVGAWFWGHVRAAAWGVVVLSTLSVVVTSGFSGGLHAASLYGLSCPPLLAALVLGWRPAFATTAASFLAVGVLGALDASGLELGPEPRVEALLVSMVAATTFTTLIAGLTEHQTRAALQIARDAADASKAALAERSRELARRLVVERQLQEALAAAQGANEAKSQFLANMSHELRTPLNAIIGYAEILQEDAPEDGSTREDLQRIQGAGRHLLTLINDVLDLSRIEAGRMQLSWEEVDARALLDEVVATARPLVAQNRNRFVVEAPDALPTMLTDALRARQIVLNLLSNAAKFTQDGEVTLAVSTVTLAGQPALRLAVTDTGIGIPPEVMARLFRPFVQADASTSRRFGGTGLGLVLCARLSALLGGRIDARSEPGTGSTFEVVLPLRGSAARMRELATRRLAEAETAARPVVLCIDDEPDALDVLDRTLTGAGMHVVPLDEPAKAIEVARRLRPAVITLDVRMPDPDGWALLSTLKQDPDLRHVPVVMVSITDESRRAFAFGATDWLTKPVDRARLVVTLDRLSRGADGPVLVVEDDEDTRRILAQTLATRELPVVVAENGARALEHLERVRPRAVLLDLMMPEVDGFEVARRMRETPAWADIPIVVLTAATLSAGDRERLAHCVGVFGKDAAGLSAVVEQVRRAAPARTPAPSLAVG